MNQAVEKLIEEKLHQLMGLHPQSIRYMTVSEKKGMIAAWKEYLKESDIKKLSNAFDYWIKTFQLFPETVYQFVDKTMKGYEYDNTDMRMLNKAKSLSMVLIGEDYNNKEKFDDWYIKGYGMSLFEAWRWTDGWSKKFVEKVNELRRDKGIALFPVEQPNRRCNIFEQDIMTEIGYQFTEKGFLIETNLDVKKEMPKVEFTNISEK